MLNQLIESKSSTRENKRRGGFLLTTFTLLAMILLGSWTYSLFAKDYAMGGGELELSRLVAPVPVEQQQEEEPPPPEQPEPRPEKAVTSKTNKVILKEFYEDLDKSAPPKDVLGEREVVTARQFDPAVLQRGRENLITVTTEGRRSPSGDEDGCGLCRNTAGSDADEEREKTPEVVVKRSPTPDPTPERPQPPRSIGVVNGKASYLAMPPYPLPAKQLRIEGAVNVQVLIDEQGSVVSATAVSGHPLLRPAAVSAARQSKFTPTLLSKQPIKVTGVIVYNFKAQN